jgi:hypothetical protein
MVQAQTALRFRILCFDGWERYISITPLMSPENSLLYQSASRIILLTEDAEDGKDYPIAVADPSSHGKIEMV